MSNMTMLVSDLIYPLRISFYYIPVHFRRQYMQIVNGSSDMTDSNSLSHLVKIQNCDVRMWANYLQRDSRFESAQRSKICRQPALFRKIVYISCIPSVKLKK